MMVAINSETQQVRNPLEENHLLSLAEITKVIQYKKNPKGIIDTDYHLCCTYDHPSNPIEKMSDSCTTFLSHVFYCQDCEDEMCRQFKNDLFHSFTCCEESMFVV